MGALSGILARSTDSSGPFTTLAMLPSGNLPPVEKKPISAAAQAQNPLQAAANKKPAPAAAQNPLQAAANKAAELLRAAGKPLTRLLLRRI